MSSAPRKWPSRSTEHAFLSERDKLLLVRKFDVPQPEALSGLVERLPDNVAMPTILFRYDVTPDGGMRKKDARQFVSCAHCHAARHWRGFVLELAEGPLALIGEDCGEEQFGIDFRRVESDFHTARNRQGDLQRLIEIRYLLLPLERELDMLRSSAAVGTFDAYMSGLRCFGKLRFALQQIAQQRHGLLTCTSYERDLEAEARREHDSLEAAYHRDRIVASQNDGVRRRRIDDRKRWLRSLPPIECATVEAHGRMVGGAIFDMAPGDSLSLGMRATRAAIQAQANEFLSNGSEYWTKRGLARALNKLRQSVGLVYRALTLLAELDRFASADNLATVAKWSQREVMLPHARIEFSVKVDGRTLIDEDDRHILALPSTWAVPSAPCLAALREALGD